MPLDLAYGSRDGPGSSGGRLAARNTKYKTCYAVPPTTYFLPSSPSCAVSLFPISTAPTPTASPCADKQERANQNDASSALSSSRPLRDRRLGLSDVVIVKRLLFRWLRRFVSPFTFISLFARVHVCVVMGRRAGEQRRCAV
jgi:hypothetical protein